MSLWKGMCVADETSERLPSQMSSENHGSISSGRNGCLGT